MPEQNRSGSRVDGHELGRTFEEQNTPSWSGDLGPAFEETNKGPQDNPRRKWYWIGGILLLVLLVFVIHHYSGDTTAQKSAAGAPAGGGRHGGAGGPAAITIANTTQGNMPVYVQALGTVTPTFTVTLYSQVTGRVLAVHYTEGQLVKKGQPLVDIDPQPYQATLQQAEGNLKHDEGVLAEAQMDLKRYQDAAAKNAISRQQLEDQEKTVIQDEGSVQADKGTVQYDQVQLAYCHIVSPIAGRVGLRLVDPGNTVFSGSSSTLAVITALQPMTVVFNVSEDDLPAVQGQLKGHNVLRVDAFDRANDQQLETGKLTSLDNQIDTTTGTIKFRATFPNKDLTLFPNQFVNARLLLKTLQGVTLVPNAAVQHNGTAAFVYIVKSGDKGDTVAVQDVDIIGSDENNSAATGVAPNVTVATSGFDRLEPGAKVKPQQPSQHAGKGGNGAAGKHAASSGQNGAPAGPASQNDTTGNQPTSSSNNQPGSGNGNGGGSKGSGGSR